MKNILKDTNNSEKLLNMTSDTLVLMNKDGVCVDIAIHNVDLWFLKEEKLLGKNLLTMLPSRTYSEFYPEFKKVLSHRTKSTRNYELCLKDNTYFFKCIMQPYGALVLCQYRDITERSQQKLELERNNRELYEIQKAALIGSWQYESDTRTFSYTGHTNIMCTEEPQHINVDIYLQYILPEDRETFNSWLEQNLQGDMESSVDYRILYQEQIFYIRLKAFARERHKDGSTTMEGYIQNITDIQRRRNDINLLTHAIDNSTEDIYSAREDGTLIFANRCFKDRHNISNTDDITQIKIYDLQSYGRNQKTWKEFAASVKRGESNQGYIVHNPLPLRPEVLAIEGNSYWVTSDEGIGTVWTFGRDVTQRIRQEQEIKQLNQVLDKIIENLPAGVVVKDIKNGYKYIYRNRESYNRDITMQEALGKDDYDFYSPEIAEEKRKQDIEVTTTGQEMHWVVEERDGNGTPLFLDKRKLKIESNDFPPILLSIEWDITDMELMKRELMVAKEKAETSDQLKSAFLANMSHEIRTPLNAIVGFSGILASTEEEEEKQEYVSIIENNNTLLLQLISDILDLSKIEAGTLDFKYSNVNLNTLMKELECGLLLRVKSDAVKLEFVEPTEPCIAYTEKNRLSQLMINLVANAIKFTEKGSIRFGYEQRERELYFYVADTGCGIPKDKQQNIFGRFVKLNSFAQGTGLGLSICKTLLDHMDGKIGVESEEGQGSTFWFTLPYKPAVAVDKVKKLEDIQPIVVEKGKLTILIAEDNASNYKLFESILKFDYHLIHAWDGREAVELFREHNPQIVLMDINMPVMDGYEATQEIRKYSAKVPIIAVTAFAYASDEQKVMESGFDGYMPKPINAKLLKAQLKDLMQKRIVLL